MFRKFGMLVLSLVVLSVTAQAQSKQDPFLGTWKSAPAKSTYNPGPPPADKTPVILTRETTANGAQKVTINGKELYTIRYDDKAVPMIGSATGRTVAFDRINSRTVIHIYKENGKVVRINRIVVAADGKSSTGDDFGVSANGVPYHNVTVWEKQ